MRIGRILLVALVALIGLFTISGSAEGSGLGGGFGDHLPWKKNIGEAFSDAKTKNQPVMVLIHKSWCGACKMLAPKVAESQGIRELKDTLVMVNLRDDEEPSDPKYSPDGGYIPRILFFSPKGDLLDVINEAGSPQYKYYHSEPRSLIQSMKKAVDMVKKMEAPPSSEKEKEEL